ncbi:MAG: BON domain-containing protein [Gemmatimonadota bacterium]
MKNTELLQRDVVEELAWDPQVDSSHIAVTVSDGGIVTLAGSVGSFAEKLAAEMAALRVAGVRAIADELAVKLLPDSLIADERIAKAAADALHFNVAVPRNGVTVRVENGWITLAGEVPWNYQRRAAEKAMWLLHGVKGVINLISLEPRVDQGHIKHRIEAAYKRNAQIDAGHVTVAVLDDRVMLSGTVSSWTARAQAEAAAWSAPGVTRVENELTIEAPVRVS